MDFKNLTQNIKSKLTDFSKKVQAIKIGKKSKEDDDEYEDFDDEEGLAVELEEHEQEHKEFNPKFNPNQANAERVYTPAEDKNDDEHDDEEEYDDEDEEDEVKKKPSKLTIVLGIIIVYFIIDTILNPEGDAPPPQEGLTKEEIVARKKKRAARRKKRLAEQKAKEETAAQAQQEIENQEQPEVQEETKPDLDIAESDQIEEKPDLDLGEVESSAPMVGESNDIPTVGETNYDGLPSQAEYDKNKRLEELAAQQEQNKEPEPVYNDYRDIVNQIHYKQDEEVIEPQYYIEGRGLVYNCAKNHWACVNKSNYFRCIKRMKWNKKEKEDPTCIPKEIYFSTKDCTRIQYEKMYAKEVPNECKDLMIQ